MKRLQGDLRVLRNVNALSLSIDRTNIAVSNSNLTLTFEHPANIFFYGTTPGQTVTMGDATVLFKPGHEFRIHNDSSINVVVRDFGLNVLGTVTPGATVIVYLESNPDAVGVWFFGRPNITFTPAIAVPNFICDPSAAVLDLVISDSIIDTKVLVISSNSSLEIPQGVFGMIYEKPSSTRCHVMFRGLISGFSGLTKSQPYFVGTDGKLSLLVPGAGTVQKLGTAISSDAVIYDPSSPMRRHTG